MDTKRSRERLSRVPLEHQYTESSLSLQNLKGADVVKGRLLEQTCSKNGVYWFLTLLTRICQSEDYYYEEYEIEEDEFSFTPLVTPSGRTLKPVLPPFTKDELLADCDLFYGDRSPDSEDEGDYTDNESTPSTSRYHDLVVFLARKDSVIDRCVSTQSLQFASLDGLCNLVKDDCYLSPELRKYALNMVIDQTLRYSRSSYSTYTMFAGGASEVDYAKLLKEALQHWNASGFGNLATGLLQRVVDDPALTPSTNVMRVLQDELGVDFLNGGKETWKSW